MASIFPTVSQQLWRNVITVGIASYLALPLVRFGIRYILRGKPPLRRLYGNTWAIITGSSGGIGLELAKQLAEEGLSVVLIARDLSRLHEVAKEIQNKYGVQTRIVSIDATADKPDYSELKAVLTALPTPISMLWNNVGVHNDVPANVVDMLPGDAKRIITVNCLFQVEMTALVAPLLRRGTAAKSMVVNVSSLTSRMAMPMLTVYAATKAFEEHYSECLSAELAPDGIEVLCLRPGITVSRMSGIATPSFFCPSAEVMARACISKLGRSLGSCAPYWPHALLDGVNAWVPRSVAWAAVRDMHAKRRAEILTKKE